MPESFEPIICGDFSFMAHEGAVRRVCWHGIEVVRMISAPIRDANWGTVPVIYGALATEKSAQGIALNWTFEAPDGTFNGELGFHLKAIGVIEARWSLSAHQSFQTNRAGFTLLHPIQDVAGMPLEITHSNGSVEHSKFPDVISPDQPALDMAGLAYAVSGITTDIRFFGEIFEMEDQRNWSDASYKTYCRPLSKPFPYLIEDGHTQEQRIEIAVSGMPRAAGKRATGSAMSARLPEIRYAIEPVWLGDQVPRHFGLTIRWSDETAWSDSQLALIARAGQPVDLEIAVGEGKDMNGPLVSVCERLDHQGIDVARVIALPASYLKSHQPNGPWPDGPTPENVAKLVREVFPKAELGVGMLTHFTEFNRCKPPAKLGDFITHGNSAIVHAADDMSVFETLEALPHIFRSALMIAAGRDYRLGLMSIAMRSNPYGAGLVPGDGKTKLTMTDNDPRQSQSFAAAYAIAVSVLAAQSGIKSVCLAAPRGPFGAFNPDGSARPIYRAMRALQDMQSDEIKLGQTDDGLFFAKDEERTIIANASPKTVSNLEDQAITLKPGEVHFGGYGGDDD